jgi:hypothetical protein
VEAHCLPAPISELVKVPESRTTADREEGDGRAYVTAPEEPSMRPAIPAAAVWAFEGRKRSCLWSL